MPSNEEFKFVSDQVQNCLNELFDAAFNKTQDFIDAVYEISVYLVGNDSSYDYVLAKYNDVTKEMLNRMILSNFLEITYYRRKNGIPVDKTRIGILNAIESSTSSDKTTLVCFNVEQFYNMINDVLLYFWHLSPIYSYNIVQSMTEDGFAKKLYDIYPPAMIEHMLTLSDSFSRKEFLLYTFYEVLINETEKIVFSSGEVPVPDYGYLQELANILKKYNGNNPDLPNIHSKISDTFISRIGIPSDIDKVLLVEIIISSIRLKQAVGFPLDPDEKRLIDMFETTDKKHEVISVFYDNNSEPLIFSFLNNWQYFLNGELLKDLPELNDPPRKP